MEWIQVLTIILSVVGANLALILTLFLWNRSESNSDRRDLVEMVNNFKNEIQTEIRDFHEKLIRLEEKYLKDRL